MKFHITEKVIRQHFKNLGYDIRLMRAGFHEDVIHQFRVQVKKLRAFIRLLKESGDKNKGPALPSEIKQVYKIAGGIRDRQLCIKRLRQQLVGDALKRKIQVLRNEIRRLKKDVDFPGSVEFHQIKKKIIRNSAPVLTEKDIKEFLKKKLRNVKKIGHHQDLTDVELHSVRKCLKDIGYILTILSQRDLKTHGLKLAGKKKIERMEKLSQSIGLFNDIRNAISFLKNENRNHIPPGNKGRLGMLRKNWLSEKESIKAEIMSELQAVHL